MQTRKTPSFITAELAQVIYGDKDENLYAGFLIFSFYSTIVTCFKIIYSIKCDISIRIYFSIHCMLYVELLTHKCSSIIIDRGRKWLPPSCATHILESFRRDEKKSYSKLTITKGVKSPNIACMKIKDPETGDTNCLLKLFLFKQISFIGPILDRTRNNHRLEPISEKQIWLNKVSNDISFFLYWWVM